MYDSLLQAVRKLKNQIYILSTIFAILIVVADVLGRLTTVVLSGLIIVYLIALFAANHEEERKRQLRSAATTIVSTTTQHEKEKKGSLHWVVSFPLSFPNPLAIDMVERVTFPLKFLVTNETDENLRITVYVNSPTQAIVFQHDIKATKWGLKCGLIPFRSSSRYWLDHFISSKISPNQQADFVFHGLYRKLRAVDLAVGYRIVPIIYRIIAVGEDERIRIDSEAIRVEIPMDHERKEPELAK